MDDDDETRSLPAHKDNAGSPWYANGDTVGALCASIVFVALAIAFGLLIIAGAIKGVEWIL